MMRWLLLGAVLVLTGRAGLKIMLVGLVVWTWLVLMGLAWWIWLGMAMYADLVGML